MPPGAGAVPAVCNRSNWPWTASKPNAVALDAWQALNHCPEKQGGKRAACNAASGAAAQWTAHTQTDRMSGTELKYIASEFEYPDPRMSFPYGDVFAFLAVDCREGSDADYVTEILFRDGENQRVFDFRNEAVYLRVKFDNEPAELFTFYSTNNSNGVLRESMSANRIKDADDANLWLKLRLGILRSSTMLLEFPDSLRRTGTVYFEFDLRGARQLYDQHCG